MNGNRNTRRLFLKRSGLASLAVLPGFFTSGCDVLVARDLRAAAEALIDTLDRRDLADEIGKNYLDAYGPEHAFESLARGLLESIGVNIEHATLVSAETLKKALSARIRDDFTRESVSIVNGWLLSETESRLCAMAYLAGQA